MSDRQMSNLPDFQSHGYQIVRELGCNPEGGRITYLATDTRTGEPVTVKEFRFAFAGASWAGLKAHEREIEMLRQLKHPRIPRYLDSFETPSGFGLVQEYKNAPSLAECDRFTPEQIQQIAASVLGILVYLQRHRPPIIHRDIKPENILVDDRINAYLVDFGFAKAGGKNTALSSVAAGTPGFMPPEELFNRPLTEASDLYSLGATLISLLTRTPSREMGQLIDENYCFKFRHRVPVCDRRFLTWLERMVEPNVKRRFPNASKALSALSKIRDNRSEVLPQLKPLAAVFFFALVGNMAMRGVREFTSAQQSRMVKKPEVPPVTVPFSEAVSLRQQGQEFARLNDYDRALAAYDRALEISPDYLEVLEGRCWVLYNLEQYDAAMRSCEKAISINPNSFRAWNYRGDILNRLSRYHEALESYNQSVAIKPNNSHGWNGRCWSLNNLQKYGDALKSCDRAIEMDGASEWPWNNRGYALEKLGRYSEAIASYDRALEINPDNATVIQNRRRTFNQLKRATIFDPPNIDWFGFGEKLRKKGSFSEALAAYEKALAVNPHHFEANLYRCRALRILGRMSDALPSCDRALAIDSNSDLAWESRAWVLRGLGRYEEALKASDRALVINPRAYWSWIEKSAALRELGEYASSLEAADRAIAIDPNRIEAWGDRGAALNGLRRHEEALDALDHALSRDSENHWAWYQRGVALDGLNRYGEALDSYHQASRFQPQN